MDLSGIALAVIAALGALFLFMNRKKKDPVVTPPDLPFPPTTPPSNLSPEVFPPFLVGELDWGGQFIIDMRHRIHGCDSVGSPINETGAFDPDGDLLRYQIDVTGPDKDGNAISYSVFDREGKKIDGKWLKENHFPVVRQNRFDANDPVMEQEAVVYCYVGHGMDEPPGVFMPMGSCPPGPIPPPPVTPTVIGIMTVMYKVRDPSGRMRSAAVTASVTLTSC